MVYDLQIIDNIGLLSERLNIVCGKKDYIRKICKLCQRAGFSVHAIYSDTAYYDDELKGIPVNSFDKMKSLQNITEYNILLAEEDNDTIDEWLEKIECEEAYIYTYYGVYNAIFANLNNSMVDGNQLKAIGEMDYAVGIYDFLSRWLRSIRWVNESAIPVLLYAMPKTGTQAMKASLLDAGIEHTYIHFLNLETSLSNQFGKYFNEKINSISTILENYEDIKLSYLDYLKNKKIKIITVVREPVARSFSMMFQGIQNWGIGRLAEGKKSICLADVAEEYIQESQSSTFDWFDEEIRRVFGIDIYQYPFNAELGYQIIKEGNVEIFVYKLEKSREIEVALRKFLGNEAFSLFRKHESAKEPHRFVYEELKKNFYVSEDVLEGIYKDERMKHFYSEDEIASFYKKWAK